MIISFPVEKGNGSPPVHPLMIGWTGLAPIKGAREEDRRAPWKGSPSSLKRRYPPRRSPKRTATHPPKRRAHERKEVEEAVLCLFLGYLFSPLLFGRWMSDMSGFLFVVHRQTISLWNKKPRDLSYGYLFLKGKETKRSLRPVEKAGSCRHSLLSLDSRSRGVNRIQRRE